MNIEKLLKSRFVTILLVVVFAGVVVITAKLFAQKLEVSREIKKLESQAARLQSENKELSELMKYLNTPEYKEKQAREKLHLAKEGEQVIVLPDSVDGPGLVAAAVVESNPKKWVKYLFGESN